MVAADGKNSSISNIVETKKYKRSYNATATVINFNHLQNHKNIAHELFYNSGPLAILPMKKNNSEEFSSSVIWTSKGKDTTSYESVLEKNFLTEILEEKILEFVGPITKIIGVQNFQLSAHINHKFYDNRIIYVGDSAHSIHPIAGQGWNLAVRDIRNCLEVFVEAKELGLELGNKYVCKSYHDKSFYDAYLMYQVTDKLNFIFLKDGFIPNTLRKIGFRFVEKSKKLKNTITRYAMGY